MSFYAFRNRLKILIEKKINNDQIVGLALAKIWALDENGRTTAQPAVCDSRVGENGREAQSDDYHQ